MIISFTYFSKLVKSVAANATWASGLFVVATSNNRWWQHCQSWWTQLKPSPIMMDAINTIIVRHQSAYKMSPSNATRKAMAISLKATRRPQQRTQQGRCVGVVSITMISTHPATTTIAARASIAAMRAQQTQTTLFCWPVQEPRVVRLTWRRQLLSPSAWPTQAAQALQWRRSRRTNATTRRVPRAWGQGLQALMPTQQACQSLVRQVPC